MFPQGRLSPWLSTLAIGHEVFFDSPRGYFVFRHSSRRPVFVATGTGVAPFVSMCRFGVGGFICLHGARTEAGLFYGGELAGQYVPCLSDGGATAGEGFKGRVTDYLRRMPVNEAYDFYLCGRQEMVHDAFEIIKDGRRLKTYIEVSDTDVCITRENCIGLGVEIAQLQGNLDPLAVYAAGLKNRFERKPVRPMSVFRWAPSRCRRETPLNGATATAELPAPL